MASKKPFIKCVEELVWLSHGTFHSENHEKMIIVNDDEVLNENNEWILLVVEYLQKQYHKKEGWCCYSLHIWNSFNIPKNFEVK